MKLKKDHKIAIGALIGVILGYLVCAFIAGSFNILSWNMETGDIQRGFGPYFARIIAIVVMVFSGVGGGMAGEAHKS